MDTKGEIRTASIYGICHHGRNLLEDMLVERKLFLADIWMLNFYYHTADLETIECFKEVFKYPYPYPNKPGSYIKFDADGFDELWMAALKSKGIPLSDVESDLKWDIEVEGLIYELNNLRAYLGYDPLLDIGKTKVKPEYQQITHHLKQMVPKVKEIISEEQK